MIFHIVNLLNSGKLTFLFEQVKNALNPKFKDLTSIIIIIVEVRKWENYLWYIPNTV